MPDLLSLLDKLPHEPGCAIYAYHGDKCVHCGIGSVHSSLPYCADGLHKHKWINTPKRTCNCARSELRAQMEAARLDTERLKQAIRAAQPALLEASQASMETLKNPGCMNGLNVHARRAYEAVQSALIDAARKGEPHGNG